MSIDESIQMLQIYRFGIPKMFQQQVIYVAAATAAATAIAGAFDLVDEMMIAQTPISI